MSTICLRTAAIVVTLLFSLSLVGCTQMISRSMGIVSGPANIEGMTVLKSDPVGAPLLKALSDYQNGFVQFRGEQIISKGPQGGITYMERFQQAQEEGKTDELIEAMVKEYQSKGWLNGLREEIFRYQIKATANVGDFRTTIAMMKANKGEIQIFKVKGLPNAPPKLEGYISGLVTEAISSDIRNPSMKRKTASVSFALPIPAGTSGAEHIRRILNIAFTQSNGWKALTIESMRADYQAQLEIYKKLPPESRKGMNIEAANPDRIPFNEHTFAATNSRWSPKYGTEAMDMLSVSFNDTYDDLGFIWVTCTEISAI